MAVTSKLDLVLARSPYRLKAKQDIRGDTAIRPFSASGLPLDTTNLDAAIDQAVSDAGLSHPVDPSLKLYSASADEVRGTLALGSLRYARGVTSNPTRAAHLLAVKSSSSMSLRYYSQPQIYDSDGRPSGVVHGIDEHGGHVTAESYPFLIDTEVIRIHTVLDSDPSSAIAGKKSTVNSAAITLAEVCGAAASGFQYPAYCLWFRGARIEPIDVGTSIRYVVDYTLLSTISPGFVQQMLFQIGDTASGARILSISNTIGEVAIIINFVFPPKLGSLTGALPCHTP